MEVSGMFRVYSIVKQRGWGFRVTSSGSLSVLQRKWGHLQETRHTWLYLVLLSGTQTLSSLPLVLLSWDCSANKSTSLVLLPYLFIEIPWSQEEMGILYSIDNGSQRKLSRYIYKIFQSGNLVLCCLFFIKMGVRRSCPICALGWSRFGKARFKFIKLYFQVAIF